MLMDVIERVKIRGDILIGKVYGYTDSYSDLKEILLSNTFAVVPSLRFGRNQKNSLDIQLVIDALDVAYTNSLSTVSASFPATATTCRSSASSKRWANSCSAFPEARRPAACSWNACSEFQFLGKRRQRQGARAGAGDRSADAFGRKRPDCDES